MLSLMKSVARNPMGAIDNINRVGYAAQTVGNLMPKPVASSFKKTKSGWYDKCSCLISLKSVKESTT